MSEKSKKRKLENTTVACPIVFGSIAFWMGKKAEEHASHRWSLYVRGPNDEDLSCFVSKIIFSLHPSFASPLREITSPPFEVTDMGWGEFEAGIRIFFNDPDEKPVDILHLIRLYPDGGGPNTATKKPVVFESYDEIVFTSPTPSFHAQLLQYTPPIPRPITWLTEHYTIFNEETDLQKLMVLQDYLAQQIDAAKIKLLRQESELGHLMAVSPPPSAHGSASQLTQSVTASVATGSSQQTASSMSKKKEGKAEKAEREKQERDKAERDKAASKKRTANAKAKKERAEKTMKEKAKVAVATASATTTTAPPVSTTTTPSTTAPSTVPDTTTAPNLAVTNTTVATTAATSSTTPVANTTTTVPSNTTPSNK